MEMNDLRAEITLGLRVGGAGPLVKKSDVLRFLRDEVTRAKAAGERWLPLRVASAVIIYSTTDGHGRSEPALILSSDRNPRYNAEMSDDEWCALVEATARKLGRKFNQERVYVTYQPARVSIVWPQQGERT